MLRLLADENFSNYIVQGLLRQHPDLDLVRVKDVGLGKADDPAILAWAAAHNRILLTHDRAMMPNFAHERILAGQAMPGVFVMSDRLALRQAIDELLLLTACSEQAEWDGLVVYLPLQAARRLALSYEQDTPRSQVHLTCAMPVSPRRVSHIVNGPRPVTSELDLG